MKDLLWFAQNGHCPQAKPDRGGKVFNGAGETASVGGPCRRHDQDRKNQSCHFWLENHRDLRASHARHLLPELQSLE